MPEGCFSLPATRDPLLFLRRSVSLVDREAIGPIRSRKGPRRHPETIRGEARDDRSSSISNGRLVASGQASKQPCKTRAFGHQGVGPAKRRQRGAADAATTALVLRSSIQGNKSLTERPDRSATRPGPPRRRPTLATRARQALCTGVSPGKKVCRLASQTGACT